MNRKQFFKWLGLGAMASIVPRVVEAAPEGEDVVTTTCTTLFPEYYSLETSSKHRNNKIL